jgi:hypothetical protein
MTNEEYVDHEVRIRLLEKIAASIDKRFEHLENKIDSHFKWNVGIMLTLFGSLLVTKFFL